MTTHLLIPDTQNKPGVKMDHLTALGNFIAYHRPDVIIDIGDWYDFPSLSSYDKKTAKAEGRRVKADIEAGDKARRMLMRPFEKIKGYDPRLVFCLGNHEERLIRFMNDNPELIDYFDFKLFASLDKWEVHKFQELVKIDGIAYTHFFANPFSGKPYGGTMQNKLNKAKMSFSQGHIQKFEYAREHLNDGQILNGLTAGAFYQHNEDYKGPQGNNHWRGVIWKSNVKDGDYDLEMIRMETLLKDWL